MVTAIENLFGLFNLKVLHVYRTYFPDTQGGLEEVIRQICCNTVMHGVESRIFTLSDKPQSSIVNFDGVDVYRFYRNFELASCGVSLKGMRAFKELADWADIINYHFPWPFADILHLSSLRKKPALVTYHSDIVRQKYLFKIYRPLMHKFLKKVDAIVPTSPNYFATSLELNKYSEKIEIIPIGLNDNLNSIDTKKHSSSNNNLSNKGFFLFVGVLRYYKGLHILLDALSGTSLKCIIVGAGPVENELKKHALNLDLKNVSFLGYVSNEEKISLFKSCRAVVFPSHLRSEAFGVTLLEGAMYGKPLISTEIGTGTSFVNIDGKTGIVVPPADVKSLRNAMLTLDKEKELAIKMGKASRLRYEKLFTGKLMGQRYYKLYKKLKS